MYHQFQIDPTGNEARKQEPLLDPHILAAIYAPEESQVKAPQVIQAYYQAAQRLGAIFYPHEEVIGFQHHDNQVTEVVTARQSISCKYLIITAGSWAAQCGEWLNLDIPVTPLKGEIISYCQPTHQLRHIIFGEGAYLAPKGESTIVGATKADTGFDTQVTEKGIAWLENATSKLIPSLAQSTFTSAWAGLRPKTPDTRPILGPAPQWKNVILATGHNSVGVILSAITGQTITETISISQIPQIIQSFTLERFSRYNLETAK
ncbi:FAD-dependent oxidoreductase [Ktedonobacter sp. SOSP1-85]|uniref:NAD(P)/FAD-dependent oxidoreductase n=1 Tax=Ktedonobacter sp. SOSP1-85 TaxID=2778367 RepID=UPI0019164663